MDLQLIIVVLKNVFIFVWKKSEDMYNEHDIKTAKIKTQISPCLISARLSVFVVVLILLYFLHL